MAASAPGYLAGQVAAVSQLLPVRAQRPSARQSPAWRPGGGDCRMRRSTTLEPNKSLKSLRRPGMSGARDVPVPEVDTIIEQAYHDTITIALAAPALVHQGDGAGEGRDGVRAGREVDASQRLPS